MPNYEVPTDKKDKNIWTYYKLFKTVYIEMFQL